MSSAVCLYNVFNSLKAPKPEDAQGISKASKHLKELHQVLYTDTHLCVIPLLPLGAVGVARMTLVVGLGILEDETVGTLQPIGALLHAVRSIFEVSAFYTLVRALRGEHNKEEGDEQDGSGGGGGQGTNKEKEVEGAVKRLVRWKGVGMNGEIEMRDKMMGKEVTETRREKHS